MSESNIPRFLSLIDDMRSSGAYEWADSTLAGIYDFVQSRQYYTDKQRGAVKRIGAARASTWEVDFDEGRGVV